MWQMKEIDERPTPKPSEIRLSLAAKLVATILSKDSSGGMEMTGYGRDALMSSSIEAFGGICPCRQY